MLFKLYVGVLNLSDQYLYQNFRKFRFYYYYYYFIIIIIFLLHELGLLYENTSELLAESPRRIFFLKHLAHLNSH